MQNDKDQPSAGLAFMRAAKVAMPKTLGDRERIAAMSAAMSLAVQNRFAFKPEDAAELRRMGIETTVGVFRPLDGYYYLACRVGGTYAKMWETFHKQKPWKAAAAVFTDYRNSCSLELLEDNRVTTNTAILMPEGFAPVEPELASHQGMQVWWVTDVTDSTINVCRYKNSGGHKGQFQRPGGAPARRRQLSREDWAVVQGLAKTAWTNVVSKLPKYASAI